MRKTVNQIIVSTAIIAMMITAVAIAGSSTNPRVIHIKAKRFEYTPAEITIKKGELVVLELTSEDVKHGFSLPDFKLRADVKPGEISRLELTPDKTGKFTFTCDIFCGAGHEDMSGTLTVTD